MKEIEIGAETKIRTKRHDREREREREVTTHTHGRNRDLQIHKKKAPQGCKERGREIQDRRREERRQNGLSRRSSGTWGHKEGNAEKSVSSPAADAPLPPAPSPSPSFEGAHLDTQL